MLFAERSGVSDCDYRTGRVVGATGLHEIARWLRERASDRDRLEVARIFNENPDPETGGRVVGVQWERRSSDTLRALGFDGGIRPQVGAKVVFDQSGERLTKFANGPFGGPEELCRVR